MKKTLASLLCLLILTFSVACGSNGTDAENSANSQPELNANNEAVSSKESDTHTEAASSEVLDTPAESTVWELNGSVLPVPKPPVSQEPVLFNYNENEAAKDHESPLMKTGEYHIRWADSDDVIAFTNEKDGAYRTYTNALIAAGYNQIKEDIFEYSEAAGGTIAKFTAYKENGVSFVFMSAVIDQGILTFRTAEVLG